MSAARDNYLKRFFGEERFQEIEEHLFEEAFMIVDLLEGHYRQKRMTLRDKRHTSLVFHRAMRNDFMRRAFERVSSEVAEKGYTLEQARQNIPFNLISEERIQQHCENEARNFSTSALSKPAEYVSRTIWAYEPLITKPE